MLVPPPSLPGHLMEMEGGPRVGWLPLSFRVEPEGQQKMGSRLFKACWSGHKTYLRQERLLNFYIVGKLLVVDCKDQWDSSGCSFQSTRWTS